MVIIMLGKIDMKTEITDKEDHWQFIKSTFTKNIQLF